MKWIVAGLAAAGLLWVTTAARADTALVHVTPKNLKEHGFQLSSKASGDHHVEFVIRRDVSGIKGPGSRGYVSTLAVNSRSLGTPVKLERDGTLWTFRFSVPAKEVAKRQFTLWGQGLYGEGVTFRFHMGEFR